MTTLSPLARAILVQIVSNTVVQDCPEELVKQKLVKGELLKQQTPRGIMLRHAWKSTREGRRVAAGEGADG